MDIHNMKETSNIAILGAGNIGSSIANGLVQSGCYKPENIILTRRRLFLLDEMKECGFEVAKSNIEAVNRSRLIIIAVEPQQIDRVLNEIGQKLNPERHIVISVVTAVTIEQITEHIGDQIPIVRAMPNTAIAVRESMTCLASNGIDKKATLIAESIFATVGKTLQVSEEEMLAATALGACGVAFFLRAVRAASQGGIEIGFHSNVALSIAALT
jgi:pyrroline-5-carboxylate reductase